MLYELSALEETLRVHNDNQYEVLSLEKRYTLSGLLG